MVMARERAGSSLQSAGPAHCCFCLGSKHSSRMWVQRAAALLPCAHDLPAWRLLPLQHLSTPVLGT